MCGIAGLISSVPQVKVREQVNRMRAALRHRGPDDCGEFFTNGDSVGLGHTRLAILDLSQAGHQPMHSADGRYVMVYNGEIYNFRQLRAELESQGVSFRGHSDTEVILALFARQGPDCVKQLDGMFAFAIWDTKDHTLFVARDPLGIKPLYLWHTPQGFAFASEMRSLFCAQLASLELDPDALFQYLQLGSVTEPHTLVRGITVLPAGHYGLWQHGQLTQTQYWSLDFTNACHDPEAAVRITRAALNESLDRHFVSDVPVGLFLSGGLDSTALAMMARESGRTNLQTLCISFENPEYNEGALAQRTAAHIGARHTDWRMTAKDGALLAGQYLAAMDRPGSDGFNTFCVSKLAADCGIKVVLSGLGGDELFAGYPSFRMIPRLLRLHKNVHRLRLASPIRHGIQRLNRKAKWQRLGEFLALPGSVYDAWTAMRGHFTHRESTTLVRWMTGDDRWSPQGTLAVGNSADSSWSVADQISWHEITGYMRNQLLRDSDVMSMAWGLELRVPFVDRKLIDAVSRIDSGIRLKQGKQLLLNAVPELPDWIRRQPKRGFRFPFADWATSSWADWFRTIDETSPVPCQSWYRKWSLLVLQHFLTVNRISSQGSSLTGQAL